MDIDKLAEIYKALGDKTRLRILSLLKAEERCVCELVEFLGISQPTVSQHMRRLKSVHLVKERRQGRWVYYSLDGSAWPFFHFILESLPDPEQENKTVRKVVCD
ncbi:ArsR/SmtB family transcription factor [Desmospora activa]|uniref:ArsR family transcriptional regulator n=1 Tax=Desmospora activa DSM 45169 TaxID=1121389 RepID=A0A2T4ZDG5_9BACL|nr:metalloregulator ArsR/SmtB family transcription factor [Desmospora activa]PTM59933.1 ArsR family transcriptional regulator [Desmospora activa DSM 45169]